ncbi:MAG: hypothetical protein H6Q79_2433 [Deltaproteobacteria bacterium]|nr:hypothetical protein [Deltaproteobacteria bacterium]
MRRHAVDGGPDRLVPDHEMRRVAAQGLPRGKLRPDEQVRATQRLAQEDLEQRDRGVGAPRHGDRIGRQPPERFVRQQQDAHHAATRGDGNVGAQEIPFGVHGVLDGRGGRQVQFPVAQLPVQFGGVPVDERNPARHIPGREPVEDRDEVGVRDATDAQRSGVQGHPQKFTTLPAGAATCRLDERVQNSNNGEASLKEVQWITSP